MMDIKSKAEQYFGDTVSIRRDLHRYPEPSGKEIRTSEIISKFLTRLNIPWSRPVGNSIIGIIDSGKPGKTVALRADIDALLITENPNKEYCSCVEGVGHLCGHDCHTAGLLTAARILESVKENFIGKVKLIFQAAEEMPAAGYAKDLVANGLLDDVDAIFALHMDNDIDVGNISVQSGVRLAASFRAYIEVTGVGGHSGSPHLCVDPVLAASAIVMNLQTISSRELNISDSAIITVGMIHGGNTPNAIPSKVNLGINVKVFNDNLTKDIEERISRVAKNTAAVFRATAFVRFEGHVKPVVNDKKLADIANISGRKIVGNEHVIARAPWPASEDFSSYLERVPGEYVFVGSRNVNKGYIYHAHNPSFDIDEDALKIVPALYAQFAVDYLNSY